MSTSLLNTEAELNALLELISSSVKEVITYYKDAGYAIPSLSSTETSPFDLPRNAPLNMTKALQVIEGACAQLCAVITPPGRMMYNVSMRSVVFDIILKS